MKNIILIGFMGAGKSAVGRYISDNTEYKIIDTDYYIEKKENCKISEIFAEKGEEYFREAETKALEDILKFRNNSYVISVGGGLPMREENRVLMHKLGTVIYLRATVDTLENRLKGDTKRPLLQGGDIREKITALMEKREAVYESAADAVIDTDNKEFEDVFKEIKEIVK